MNLDIHAQNQIGVNINNFKLYIGQPKKDVIQNLGNPYTIFNVFDYKQILFYKNLQIAIEDGEVNSIWISIQNTMVNNYARIGQILNFQVIYNNNVLRLESGNMLTQKIYVEYFLDNDFSIQIENIYYLSGGVDYIVIMYFLEEYSDIIQSIKIYRENTGK